MGKRMESLGCKIWVWSNQGKRFCMELKSRIDNMTGCIPDRWVSLGSWNRACCCIVHYLPWQKVEVSHGKIVLLLWFSWHDVSEHFTVVREVFCTNSEKKKSCLAPNWTHFCIFYGSYLTSVHVVELGWRKQTSMNLHSSRWAKSSTNSETLDAEFLTRTKGEFGSLLSQPLYVLGLCSLEV